jgi:SAM-dependent methyltransferase
MSDALLFHTHHAHFQEDLPYWKKLAQQYGDPILELGCGTGRVSLPLAEAGYQITGIDNDLEMLVFTRRRTAPLDITQLPLVQADMAELLFNQKFHLIISPCNTLSTLPFFRLRKTVLNVYHQLETGGCFAVSLPNPNILDLLPVHTDTELELNFTHPIDGEPVQVSNRWVREDNQVTFYWYYDHLLPDGKVKRTELKTTHYLSSPSEYIDLLHENGLKDVQLFGDYEFSRYTPDSLYLNILAVK